MTTDELLIIRLCNHEKRSLEIIYNRYELLLWNIVSKTILDRNGCEMIIAQVFQELWNSPQSFNNGRKLSTSLIECCKSHLQSFTLSKSS